MGINGEALDREEMVWDNFTYRVMITHWGLRDE